VVVIKVEINNNYYRRKIMTTSNKAPSHNIESYETQVESFFGEIADEQAKQSSFVQRRSKISGSIFLQALVWTVYKVGCITLSSLAAVAEHPEPSCKVSEQAFDLRFNSQAVDFMKSMFVLAFLANGNQSKCGGARAFDLFCCISSG
jgi:hypothetical protein